MKTRFSKIVSFTFVAACFSAIPVSGLAQPKQWPKQVGGTGSMAAVKLSFPILCYGWWESDGFSVGSWVVCGDLTKDFIPSWEKEGSRLSVATDADRLEAWKKYTVKREFTAAEKVVVTEVVKEMQFTKPVIPTYRVAVWGLVTDRPTYFFNPVTGIRSTVSNGRVNIGATCDCSVRLISGTTLWCAVTEDKKSVAVCSSK